MSDNLKQLEQKVDQTIDPNAGISGIKALKHNELLKDLLQKVGKYTGIPYIIKSQSNAGVISTGVFSWNANPLNNTNNFTITVSKKTADLNDFGIILSKLSVGDIIKFKDYSGRSAFYEFQQYQAGQDSSNNDIYNIEIKGFADNTNYAYSNTDEEIGFLEFFYSSGSSVEKITIDGVEYQYKKNSANGTVQAPAQYDIAEYGVRSVTEDSTNINLMTTLSYNSGPVSDISSWVILSEIEV